MKKILRNVFIPANDNNLFFGDIIFNTKILAMQLKSRATVPWSSIDTMKKRDAFIANNFPSESIILSDDTFDGAGTIAIPGGIDPHVHFNTPGFEEREDFEHGSHAAACGGVTTVIDMPCTSLPPVTTHANLNRKKRALKNRSLIDYAFWGGIGGCMLRNGSDPNTIVQELHEAGVAGFKVYLLSGMHSFADLTLHEIEKVAHAVKNTGKILAVHAEDKHYVLKRQHTYQQQGLNGWADYCNARSIEAEVIAVKNMIHVAHRTGCRVHIVHLSSAKALNLIRKARKSGIDISTETCPHYLRFTQEDFNNKRISAYLKTAPPVKEEEDRQALWDGLRDGSISFVTTDHAGCDPKKEKTDKDFWKVYGGIPGVEHRVPYMISSGFLSGTLTLEQTMQLISGNAADFFGLKAKGYLKKGFDADICLLNPWKTMKVKSSGMHSKGKYTPFHGDSFRGVIEAVFLRGNLILNTEQHIIPDYKSGKFISVQGLTSTQES